VTLIRSGFSIIAHMPMWAIMLPLNLSTKL
jgi:hypothetical protein